MEQYSRKYVFDIFSEKLRGKFAIFCREHRQQDTLENFITYLIDQDIIPPSTIKHYAINETFNELYASSAQPKTEVVNTLADRFNLSPRSIWNALRKNIPPTSQRSPLRVSSRSHKV
ncbi:MAG: hypothetical protein ACK4TA_06355 [Saprospiraceae bacterium]